MINHIRITAAILAAVALAGCATTITPEPTTFAITQAPYDASFGIGASIAMPPGTPLVAAIVGGNPAFCSLQRVVSQIGDSLAACFYPSKDGPYFDRWHVAGTMSGSDWMLPDIHLPYITMTRDEFVQNVVPGLVAADAEQQQARAACAYQGHVAAISETPAGIIPAVATGFAANQACADYYEHIGVLP